MAPGNDTPNNNGGQNPYAAAGEANASRNKSENQTVNGMSQPTWVVAFLKNAHFRTGTSPYPSEAARS
jgi:hypothetical protein